METAFPANLASTTPFPLWHIGFLNKKEELCNPWQQQTAL